MTSPADRLVRLYGRSLGRGLIWMRLVAVLAAFVVVLAGCGNDRGSSIGAPSVLEQTPQATRETPAEPVTATPTPSPTATTATPANRTGTVIKSAKSDFGKMLFDGTGQAIYLFDKEQTTKPECYGACAEAWPPVLTKGMPTAEDGAKQNLLDTTKRTDGKTQVTYGGHPLYYYAHEAKNEVKCHNIRGFGGLWLVVTPTGRAAAP
jgi:predicted lipoprotein with Yx(FWY)xxD motif